MLSLLWREDVVVLLVQNEYEIRNLNCQIVQTKANRFTNNCNKIVLLILLAKQRGVHWIQASPLQSSRLNMNKKQKVYCCRFDHRGSDIVHALVLGHFWTPLFHKKILFLLQKDCALWTHFGQSVPSGHPLCCVGTKSMTRYNKAMGPSSKRNRKYFQLY